MFKTLMYSFSWQVFFSLKINFALFTGNRFVVVVEVFQNVKMLDIAFFEV